METPHKIQENWNGSKTKIKQNCPTLNDTDLVYSIVNENKLVVCLIRKLGKTPRRNSLLN